jgi:hypothetical protein
MFDIDQACAQATLAVHRRIQLSAGLASVAVWNRSKLLDDLVYLRSTAAADSIRAQLAMAAGLHIVAASLLRSCWRARIRAETIEAGLR